MSKARQGEDYVVEEPPVCSLCVYDPMGFSNGVQVRFPAEVGWRMDGSDRLINFCDDHWYWAIATEERDGEYHVYVIASTGKSVGLHRPVGH